MLEGVLMAVPYTHTVLHHYVDSDNQERVRQQTTTRYLFSVPQTMDFFTKVEPEYLTRGIFDVTVFACETKFSGIFSPAAYQHLKISERDIRWDEALLLFGIFNVVFLPRFYRTGVNVGRSYLVSMIPVTLYIVAAEVLVHVPGLGAYLDGTGAAAQLAQLPVLAGGAVLYALLTWAAFRTAAARFEKVDL